MIFYTILPQIIKKCKAQNAKILLMVIVMKMPDLLSVIAKAFPWGKVPQCAYWGGCGVLRFRTDSFEALRRALS